MYTSVPCIYIQENCICNYNTLIQIQSLRLELVDYDFCLLELVFLDIWIHLIVPVATPPQTKCLIIIKYLGISII